VHTSLQSLGETMDSLVWTTPITSQAVISLPSPPRERQRPRDGSVVHLPSADPCGGRHRRRRSGFTGLRVIARLPPGLVQRARRSRARAYQPHARCTACHLSAKWRTPMMHGACLGLWGGAGRQSTRHGIACGTGTSVSHRDRRGHRDRRRGHCAGRHGGRRRGRCGGHPRGRRHALRQGAACRRHT